MRHFNELTPAELERLALLSEELGEVQQCIGKILRHGYESTNPLNPESDTNRQNLEKEMGDVLAAIMILCGNRDLSRGRIETRSDEKQITIRRWMHHQAEMNAREGR